MRKPFTYRQRIVSRAFAGALFLFLFTPLAFAEASQSDQIQAYYRKYLGRDADSEGLRYWLSQPASGVETSIASSAEAREFSIKGYYTRYTGRDADEAGLAYWSQQAANGRSLADIEGEIKNSQEASLYTLANTKLVPVPVSAPLEHVTESIDGFFLKYLGRHADLEGLEFWKSVAEDQTLAAAESGIANSPEATRFSAAQTAAATPSSATTTSTATMASTLTATSTATVATVNTATVTAAATSSRRGEPSLKDLFSGAARFQQPVEAERISIDYDGAAINTAPDQLRMSVYEAPGDPENRYFTVARIKVAEPYTFHPYLFTSTDAVHFKRAAKPLFTDRLALGWVYYDAHIALDTSVSPARYILSMECAGPGYSFSLCVSQSSTPLDGNSWSVPQPLVRGGDKMSASTGAVLADDGSYYGKWSVVDMGKELRDTSGGDDSGTDEGIESVSTWGTKLTSLTKADQGSVTNDFGTPLLKAERNTTCTSSWDCNNQDAQDWKREDDYYYLIYNGSQYYGCTRPKSSPGRNLWQLAIRRSHDVLGDYSASTGPLISAVTEATCATAYPVVNVIQGVHYLYYGFMMDGFSGNLRSRLVWIDYAGDVTKIYQALLGRAPDQPGSDYWVAALQNGANITSVRESIAGSKEMKTVIGTLYQSLLGRAADDTGLAFWQESLSKTGSLQDIETSLKTSTEYKNKHP